MLEQIRLVRVTDALVERVADAVNNYAKRESGESIGEFVELQAVIRRELEQAK